MNVDKLARLAARVHEGNAKWWVNLETGERIGRNIGEMMMLVTSELAEALEGHRKDLMDDKLPDRKMFDVELIDTYIRLLDLIGGLDVSIVDVSQHLVWSPNVGEQLMQITRIVVRAYEASVASDRQLFGVHLLFALDAVVQLATHHEIPLDVIFEEKHQFNSKREDHTIEARKKAGGKKY